MGRWWRAYDDALDDPKVQMLPPVLFKFWFNLLCVASKYEGLIPPTSELVARLKARSSHVQHHLEALIERGLVDRTERGLEPHNWLKRQYKSDSSTERVKRFRNVARNVTETPPEYRVQITDTESKKDIRSVAVATRPAIDEDFEKFWKGYPKRDGSNPKHPARKAYLAALKAGTEAAAILAGAVEYGRREARCVGTPYIARAVTWLRERRWEDYTATPDGMPAGLTPEQQQDWRGGWRPGMPSSAEIMKGKSNGSEATGIPMGGRQSLVQSGVRLGSAKQGVSCGEARQSGTSGLGQILRRTGMDPLGISRARQVDPAMDGAGPLADMASD